MSKKPDLNGAYALETPEDSVKLYSEWSETYDESFAAASGYQLPVAVAEAYIRADGVGPVLDVGAGTGLVGTALHEFGIALLDGMDISSAMLAEAAMKDCYENLFEGDLTQKLDIETGHYAGIVSAGTFTHGHVGPDALDELIRVGKQDALYVLSINAEHFEARGFKAKFTALGDQIKGLILHKTSIYDEARDDAHGNDQALLAVFRKA